MHQETPFSLLNVFIVIFNPSMQQFLDPAHSLALKMFYFITAALNYVNCK